MPTAPRFQPPHRRAGFVLIWVLVLGVLMAALTSFALSSGRNRVLSAQVSATDTRDQLLLNDADLYAQRLLAVHASDLASAAARQQPALPGGTSGVLVTSALQEQADQLFCRKFQQPGVTARVAFSPRACGSEVSSPPDSPTVTATGQGGQLVSAPYSVTLTTSGGAQRVQRGLLRYVTGGVPVSGYALYQSADATLTGDLSVTGPSYVLGEATLLGTFTTTSLGVSGCAVPGADCTGPGGLHFGDGTYRAPMSLVPSAAHPCVASGCVTGTVNPAETGDALLATNGAPLIFPAFDHVILGVGSTGEQRVTLCQNTCVTYLQSGTTLTTDSGTLLSETFDGLYRAAGNVLVEPEFAGDPSVTAPVTVQAGGEITVNGDLRLANSPCPAGGDCTLDGNPPGNLLGLIAGGNITLNAGAIDAALLSGASVLGRAQENAAGTLVLGSVAAGAHSSNLRVTHDPRLAAPSLTRPVGFPLLSANVHLVTLRDGQ